MSNIDRMHMLKKIRKEVENILAWQEDIYTALHNIHANWVTSGQFPLARMPRAASGKFLEGNGVGADPIFNALVAGDIPNLDAAKITSGIFDIARIPTPLKSKALSEVFTSGAEITAKQVVYISGDNQVSPADNTKRSQTAGVALETKGIGLPVEVAIYGKVTDVIADGPIAPGDPVAAAATPGRVVSLTAHLHSIGAPSTASFVTGIPSSTGNAGGHGHTFTGSPGTTGSDGSHIHAFTPSGIIGSVDNHRHNCPTTGSAGAHSHTFTGTYRPTGAASGTAVKVPRWDFDFEACDAGHALCKRTGTGGASVTDFSHTHGYTPEGSISEEGAHTHSVGYTTYAGGHDHPFTGSLGNTDYAGTHDHSFTPSGTISSVDDHGHSIGAPSTASAVTSIPSETGSVGTAQILGKALTAAAGAGSPLDVLVCLAG